MIHVRCAAREKIRYNKRKEFENLEWSQQESGWEGYETLPAV